MLANTALLHSSAYHFFETPDSLSGVLQSLWSTRASAGVQRVPQLVWAPKPSHCRSDQLGSHLQACRLVDVFSPSHLELIALVQRPTGSTFDRSTIEQCVKLLLDYGVGPTGKGYVLVRCGEHGCFIKSARTAGKWFPPYHTDPRMVVDATGGASSFLGGFTIGMQMTFGNPTEGVIRGTVAASFVIEQFGLPTRTVVNNAERWNGVDPQVRLRAYRSRVTGRLN